MRSHPRWIGAVAVALLCAVPPLAEAKSAHGSSAHSPKAHAHSAQARDHHGRIPRSEAAKHHFEADTGYPHGRPGYVVDHIVPLACGGADAPSNMQWQTVAEGKAKDKVERVGCR